MSEKGSEFTTSVGRLVWGHPSKLRAKTKDGAPVLDPLTGQPVMQCVFGVAIPKPEFEQSVLPWLQYETSTLFASGVPNGYAWKYVDGDSPEAPWVNGKQGTPYNAREGYPGHYVMTLSTELPGYPQNFVLRGGAYFQLQEHEMKTGDYLRVKVNAKAHGGQSPGLYVNPMLVELVGEGPAIISAGAGGDPMAAFGGQAAQLPPGATAPGMGAPPAPPAYAPPGQPAAPAPGYPPQPPAYAPPAAAPAPAPAPGYPPQPPAYAPPAAAPAPAPGQMPPPHTGIIPGAPPAPPAYAPPGQPPAYAPPAAAPAPAPAPGYPPQGMPPPR